MSYQHTKADHTVFTCTCNGTLSIIALYIDDITMASGDLESISQHKVSLKESYEMTDLGDLS